MSQININPGDSGGSAAAIVLVVVVLVVLVLLVLWLTGVIGGPGGVTPATVIPSIAPTKAPNSLLFQMLGI